MKSWKKVKEYIGKSEILFSLIALLLSFLVSSCLPPAIQCIPARPHLPRIFPCTTPQSAHVLSEQTPLIQSSPHALPILSY